MKKIVSLFLVLSLLLGMTCLNVSANNVNAFEIKNIEFTYVDDDSHAYTIRAGKTVRVTAEAKRVASGNGEIYLAVCLYNTTNSLRGIVKSDKIKLGYGESKTITVDYQLPAGINGGTTYLAVYGVDAKDGMTIYESVNRRDMYLPENKSGLEETVHLNVGKDTRQTFKGMGVSFTESHRVGGGFDRNKAGYELLYSPDGTDFNLLRLWGETIYPSAEYDEKTGKVKLLDGTRTFKSSYIDSGLIEEAERLTEGDLKIAITISSLFTAEMRESAAQNVVLNVQNAVQTRNAEIKEDRIYNIKDGASVVFGGIDVLNSYKSVKITAGSEYGGTIYVYNADKGSILASLPIEPTGGNDIMKEFTFPRNLSLKGVKEIKLAFDANAEEFGSLGSVCIDGNAFIKTSKIPACADLMAAYVETIVKDYNVEVDYLTMRNEPLFEITPQQLRQLVKEMRKALDRRGLADVKILADEWAEIDELTLYSWKELLNDKEALAAIDGFSFHSYGTNAIDYYKQATEIFKAAGKEVWVTESSDTEVLTHIENGDLMQASNQIVRLLNDLNNYVEYWVHFFGVAWGTAVGGGSNATSIVGVSKAEKDWLTTNGTYKYYKHIMDTFDYGCVFRYCTTTEYGDMSRPRGKKPPISAAFAQNEDGTYTLAMVNASDKRNFAEGWVSQNDDPFAIKENIEVYIEELSDVAQVEFDAYRSGPDGIYVDEGSIVAKNGKLSVTLEPYELLTLRSK